MKGLTNILNAKLLLTGLFSLMVIMATAQVPSKGVQKYANKKAYEKAEQPNTNILSVTTPRVAVSKDIHKTNTSQAILAEDNMISKGFPYWTIAKGVHVHHSNPAMRADYIARKK